MAELKACQHDYSWCDENEHVKCTLCGDVILFDDILNKLSELDTLKQSVKDAVGEIKKRSDENVRDWNDSNKALWNIKAALMILQEHGLIGKE